MKELYRAVVQRRPILAMLEPDATQEGGLDQAAVEALITNAKVRQTDAEHEIAARHLCTLFAMACRYACWHCCNSRLLAVRLAALEDHWQDSPLALVPLEVGS